MVIVWTVNFFYIFFSIKNRKEWHLDDWKLNDFQSNIEFSCKTTFVSCFFLVFLNYLGNRTRYQKNIMVLGFSSRRRGSKPKEMIEISLIYWPQWNGTTRAETVGHPIFFSIFWYNLKINLIAFSHCRRHFFSLLCGKKHCKRSKSY